jgi:hypothetical protein
VAVPTAAIAANDGEPRNGNSAPGQECHPRHPALDDDRRSATGTANGKGFCAREKAKENGNGNAGGRKG